MSMYDVVISYDLTTKNEGVHDAIKKCMIAKGYCDRFTNKATNKIIYLPNTTLWIKDSDSAAARKDLKDCLAEWNKDKGEKDLLERCFALKFDDGSWAAIQGEEHSIDCDAPLKG